MISQDIIVSTRNHGMFRICEGTGDNLLKEDIADGYVDYIMIDPLVFTDTTTLEEGYDNCGSYEGGQVMLLELYQEQFKEVDDVIRYLKENEWLPDEQITILYNS